MKVFVLILVLVIARYPAATNSVNACRKDLPTKIISRKIERPISKIDRTG